MIRVKAIGIVHRWRVPLPMPSEVVRVLVWKGRQGFILAASPARSTGASAVSCLWHSASDTCLCFTVSSTVLAWASSLMRRLSRQLWAVLSVLRSCALVKLYIVVSCTSFWTSSRVALAVVSWSTCCCRLSSVRASLLLVGTGAFFWRRGMSGLWAGLCRVEPESSDESHGVMYCDITTGLRLPRRGSIQVGGQRAKRRPQGKPQGLKVLEIAANPKKHGWSEVGGRPQCKSWHKYCVTTWREPRRRRTEKNCAHCHLLQKLQCGIPSLVIGFLARGLTSSHNNRWQAKTGWRAKSERSSARQLGTR